MRFGTLVPKGWKMALVGVPVEAQWDRIAATAATIEEAGYGRVCRRASSGHLEEVVDVIGSMPKQVART